MLLTEPIKQANLTVTALEGTVNISPAPETEPDPAVSLIPVEVNLADQSLLLLERELARLRTLVGVDAQNAKRFTTLSDKITKSEAALIKVIQQIERVHGADERIRALIEARRSAYAAIFEATGNK